MTMPTDIRAHSLAITTQVIATEALRAGRCGDSRRLETLLDQFRRSAETLAAELAPGGAPAVTPRPERAAARGGSAEVIDLADYRHNSRMSV